ncbi:MAG: sortase, partial [Actinomycetota bacterium]|nr:sortase [Actinomycetota bacterium]
MPHERPERTPPLVSGPRPRVHLHPAPPAGGGRDLGGRASVLVLAVLVAGLFLTATAAAVTRTASGSATSAAGSIAAEPPPASATALGLRDPLPANPVRVRIPAISAASVLDRLGLNGDGTLQVPPYDRAGWFGGTVKPGETGPAVIAAHVDSRTGPAVFYQLKLLRPGDTVMVDYDDATTIDFTVRAAQRFPKSDFPTAQVYGATSQPELRLITCGGSFDRRASS